MQSTHDHTTESDARERAMQTPLYYTRAAFPPGLTLEIGISNKSQYSHSIRTIADKKEKKRERDREREYEEQQDM